MHARNHAGAALVRVVDSVADAPVTLLIVDDDTHRFAPIDDSALDYGAEVCGKLVARERELYSAEDLVAHAVTLP